MIGLPNAAGASARSRPCNRKPIMDRRKLLQWSGAASALGAATALPERAAAAPTPALPSASASALGLDAGQMGERAGSPDDQCAALQRAINSTADDRVPLTLTHGE